MSKAPKEYTKMSGRGIRTGGGSFLALTRSFCRLWLGSDHVLLTDRTGYTETYKRFYFRDIQAIIIQRTNKARIVSIILGFFTFIFLMVAWLAPGVPGHVSGGIIAGFFGLFLSINVWRGPSCMTYVKTAVQTEQWPAWSRVKVARKGKQMLRSRLLEAQGEIPAEEMRVRLDDILRRQSESPGTNAL
jgi:hypothetical protein